MRSGIYSITYIKSGEFYIGSAKDFTKRFSTHKNALRNNIHHSSIMQNIFNKYGVVAFRFEIIELCDVENLLVIEQQYLDKYKPKFNTLMIAGSSIGYKYTDTQKKNISNGRKGKQVSPEGLAKMKAKMQSPEMRKHLSELAKGRPAPNKGIPMCEQQKLKISKARCGFKVSEETKAKIKISIKNLDYKHSNEIKRLISKSKLKFTKNDAMVIKRLYKEGYSMQKLGLLYGVMRHTISRVINGKSLYSEY